MANLLLGWPNRIDEATLTGGAWSTALPLNNLKSADRHVVARTTSASTAATQFRADLGAAYALRAVALVNHNLSQAATIRVHLGTTSGGSDVHSGSWQAVYALPFDSDLLEWEHNNWWEGLADNQYVRHPWLALYLLPAFLTARHVTVELADTANADGYVQIGRAWIGGGLLPRYNASYGLQEYWVDPSEVARTDAGTLVARRRRPYRGVRFALDAVSASDEYGYVYEMQRRQGVAREVLYLPDAADYAACQRSGFVGVMRELSPIEAHWPGLRRSVFAVEEWV